MKLVYRARPLVLLCMTIAVASHGAEVATDARYPIEGEVSGLTGAGLVLQNDAGDTLPVDVNGAFSFAAGSAGADYGVSILAQPAGALCTLAHGRGTYGAMPAARVTVACVPARTVGGAVTGLIGGGLTLRNNGGEPLAISAEGSFAFPAPLPAGSAYDIAIDTQPGESVCRVANGAGVVGGDDIANVTVTCETNALGFAYVLNTAARNISIYRIDAKSGALTTAGAPIAAGTDPLSLTIDALGRFAYVANYGSNEISVYRIDRATGALAAAGAPIALGSYPISIAVEPTGRYAYVVLAGANSIASFRIDAATGMLNAAGPTITAGAFPVFVTLDPAGRFAYVVNYGSDTVSIFSVDPASGVLNAAGPPAATGAFPFSIALDPAGRFAYVANSGSNTVTTYRVHPHTGALSASGAPARTGTDPQFISVDPAGRFAYVTNYSSGSVSAYRIDAGTGALTAAGSPVAAGGIPISLSTDPTGKFAYVATLNVKDNVTAYRIHEKSGRLSALAPRKAAASRWFTFTD